MKDKFNRKIDYLRISVTDNCNLRCIYCMEEDTKDFLESKSKISDEEIIRIVKASAKLGIRKIRITGGEPLVRKNIVDLVGKISSIEGIEEVYMTTNGILLADIVERFSKNGLKGVNISLDSLKEDTFKTLTRRGELNKVLEAIDKCIENNIKVKINTVLINDFNKDEINDFINFTINKKVDVRFIELMPIGIGKIYKGVSNDEVKETIKVNFSNVEELTRGTSDGPAKYIKVKNALGKIGFISAVSSCFCEECNRIRVTSEGFLKQCLHFNYGVSLRDLMRSGISDEELEEVIRENIFNKPEKHLFNKNDSNEGIRFMNEIGG